MSCLTCNTTHSIQNIQYRNIEVVAFYYTLYIIYIFVYLAELQGFFIGNKASLWNSILLKS